MKSKKEIVRIRKCSICKKDISLPAVIHKVGFLEVISHLWCYNAAQQYVKRMGCTYEHILPEGMNEYICDGCGTHVRR